MAFIFILVIIIGNYLLFRYKKNIFYNIKLLLIANINVLWRNRLSLVFLVFLFYLFWNVGQGQDMLVNANTDDMRVYQLFASLGIFAILNWYLPRIMYSENVEAFRNSKNKRTFSFIYHYKEKKNSNNHLLKTSQLKLTKPIEERAARVIGATSFFIIGGAILNIYILNGGKVLFFGRFAPIAYLLISIVLSIVLVNFRVIVDLLFQKKLIIPVNPRSYLVLRFKKPFLNIKHIVITVWPKTILVWSIIIAGAIAMYRLGVVNDNKLSSLILLTYSLTIYGFLFLLIVTVRRKNYFIGQTWSFCETKFKKYAASQEGVLIFYTILLIGVLIIVGVFFINVFPDCIRDFPVVVILSSFCFYFVILMAIDFFGKVYETPFLFATIFMIAIMNISDNEHHDVWRIENSSFSEADQRLSFDEYLTNWLDYRKDEIENWNNKSKYPVFFVSGEGGGSRGGFWSSYVMSDLQNAGLDTTKQIDLISNHCLGMTGASGGQVGLTVFNSFLEDDLKDKKFNTDYRTKPRAVYREDFISTSILFLFGRDLWQGFFSPAYLESADRAEKLEKEWNEAIKNALDTKEDVFTNAFLSYWYDDNFQLKEHAYQLPLLFLNSTSVENGNRGILSPVKMDSLFLDSKDLLKITHQNGNGTLRKSNGALLGARFPYVSPAGKVADGEHYVDGGYFNNLGGNTLIELYQKCKDLQDAANTTDLINKIEFHFIVLRNDKRNTSTMNTTYKEKPKANVSEVTVPLSTLLAIGSGYTNLTYEYMKQIDSLKFHSFDVQHPDSLIIPMGRYMSDDALKAMEDSYRENSAVQKKRVLDILRME